MRVSARPRPNDLRVGEIAAAVRLMLAAVTFGHQFLNRLIQHLLAPIAEELFRLAVDQHDRAALVYDDHGVRRRLQQTLTLLLRNFNIKLSSMVVLF